MTFDFDPKLRTLTLSLRTITLIRILTFASDSWSWNEEGLRIRWRLGSGAELRRRFTRGDERGGGNRGRGEEQIVRRCRGSPMLLVVMCLMCFFYSFVTLSYTSLLFHYAFLHTLTLSYSFITHSLHFHYLFITHIHFCHIYFRRLQGHSTTLQGSADVSGCHPSRASSLHL